MTKNGVYVGTLNLGRPWYNRAEKDTGLPDAGPGEYWYDYKGFYFTKENSEEGLVIPADAMLGVKLGVLHGGTFSLKKILKIIWRKGLTQVSSGFLVEDPEAVRQGLTTRGWA